MLITSLLCKHYIATTKYLRYDNHGFWINKYETNAKTLSSAVKTMNKHVIIESGLNCK